MVSFLRRESGTEIRLQRGGVGCGGYRFTQPLLRHEALCPAAPCPRARTKSGRRTLSHSHGQVTWGTLDFSWPDGWEAAGRPREVGRVMSVRQKDCVVAKEARWSRPRAGAVPPPPTPVLVPPPCWSRPRAGVTSG